MMILTCHLRHCGLNDGSFDDDDDDDTPCESVKMYSLCWF